MQRLLKYTSHPHTPQQNIIWLRLKRKKDNDKNEEKRETRQ